MSRKRKPEPRAAVGDGELAFHTARNTPTNKLRAVLAEEIDRINAGRNTTPVNLLRLEFEAIERLLHEAIELKLVRY